MHRRIRLIVVASVAVALLGAAAPAVAGPPGAIFTTNATGTWVNGNVYPDREAVYLNGGPRVNQKCTAAGLPDGEYYFQVTDPSGKALLSTDILGDRKISVLGGVIDAYLGSSLGRTGTVLGPCNGLTIQLAPFDDTLNPGGEYKVWLTPAVAGCDEEVVCEGAFDPSNSKTDNFKVQASDPDIPD